MASFAGAAASDCTTSALATTSPIAEHPRMKLTQEKAPRLALSEAKRMRGDYTTNCKLENMFA